MRLYEWSINRWKRELVYVIVFSIYGIVLHKPSFEDELMLWLAYETDSGKATCEQDLGKETIKCKVIIWLLGKKPGSLIRVKILMYLLIYFPSPFFQEQWILLKAWSTLSHSHNIWLIFPTNTAAPNFTIALF